MLEAARRLGFTLEQPHYRRLPAKRRSRSEWALSCCRRATPSTCRWRALTREAAHGYRRAGAVILHFAIDAVEAMAQAIHRLSDEVEVLPVALDHPLIRHAVAGRRPRRARAHPAFRSIGPQRSGYIGLDNHKAGRTAAVYRALMPGNGEIGIIIGDNRFTCRKL